MMVCHRRGTKTCLKQEHCMLSGYMRYAEIQGKNHRNIIMKPRDQVKTLMVKIENGECWYSMNFVAPQWGGHTDKAAVKQAAERGLIDKDDMVRVFSRGKLVREVRAEAYLNELEIENLNTGAKAHVCRQIGSFAARCFGITVEPEQKSIALENLAFVCAIHWHNLGCLAMEQFDALQDYEDAARSTRAVELENRGQDMPEAWFTKRDDLREQLDIAKDRVIRLNARKKMA